MRERKFNCYDCATFDAWQNGTEYWQTKLIIPPNDNSGIPSNYVYCETCGAIVDLDQSPEDNECEEFERWTGN